MCGGCPRYVNAIPGAARVAERWFGLSSRRALPRWQGNFLRQRSTGAVASTRATKEVLLFVDTFTNYFAHENAHAARVVLETAGYTVHSNAVTENARCVAGAPSSPRAWSAKPSTKRDARSTRCCPYVKRGVAIVGLEPSCLLGLRDEFLDYGFGADAQLLAANALLFEEFLVREKAAGRFAVVLGRAPASEAIVHGHCHQKAFAAMKPIAEVLGWIPGMTARLVDSSCCGMAGAFGYDAASLRRLDGDGRTCAAARSACRAGIDAGHRRRLQLPPPDPRWRRAKRAARRARAGTGTGRYAVSKSRSVACPQCGKPVEWGPQNPFRPFCSERCKLIDLGAWATESYRVPIAEDPDDPKSDESGEAPS